MPERAESGPERGPAGSGRTGLVFCRCGPNLGNVVSLDALEGEAWPGADDVATHPLLCSDEGRAWLESRIRERGLERVVVAACSPREHEKTFQAVLAAAGRCPSQLQMVNLREGVEWTSDGAAAATARARRLVRAGVSRVARHRPIVAGEVEAVADVLVVGSGPAGLAATRTLARRGRRVVLVEREFALGGLANRLDAIFPSGQCASCFVAPVLDEVLHDRAVEALTGAEVREVRGTAGRFTVSIELRPRRVDPSRCLGCGRCAAACPVRVRPLTPTLSPRSGEREESGPLPLPQPEAGGEGWGEGGGRGAISIPYPGCLPYASVVDGATCIHVQGGACDACVKACASGAIRLDEAPARREVEVGAIVIATGMRPEDLAGPDGVVSTWQLERMLHPDGPTGGAVRGAGGRAPRSVLLAADGVEGAEADLAAREVLKLARVLRGTLPDAAIRVAGGLGRAPGLAASAAALAADGVELADAPLAPESLSPAPGGVAGRLAGEPAARVYGLVALHRPARAGDGADRLARLLRLAGDARGFIAGGASPFEPTATRAAGVRVAGAAAGPRPIADAIRDGAAAAGEILSTLWPGARVALEPLAAEVDDGPCGGCGACVSACAFGAVRVEVREGRRRARVDPVSCRGCGTCAAACPTGAASARGYTCAQLAAEISALLSGAGP